MIKLVNKLGVEGEFFIIDIYGKYLLIFYLLLKEKFFLVLGNNDMFCYFYIRIKMFLVFILLWDWKV